MGFLRMKTAYDFAVAFDELMEKACNILPPEQFERFLDSIYMILADYED